MSFIDHRDHTYAPYIVVCWGRWFGRLLPRLDTQNSFVKQFEDTCHNNMHWYANIVSKSVYHGSNVIFLVFYQTLLSQLNSSTEGANLCITLLLGLAVMGEEKEEYISDIMEFEADVQGHIMEVQPLSLSILSSLL